MLIVPNGVASPVLDARCAFVLSANVFPCSPIFAALLSRVCATTLSFPQRAGVAWDDALEFMIAALADRNPEEVPKKGANCEKKTFKTSGLLRYQPLRGLVAGEGLEPPTPGL